MNQKRHVLFLLLLLMSGSIAVKAQQVTGQIADTAESKSIFNAVVILLKTKDSVLYKFTRSAKDGKFQLNDVKPGKYILMVTHPSFGDYVDDVTVGANGLNLNRVAVTPKSRLLQAIILKTGGSMRIKGDTVNYTADSFKVSANANVEELLKKLPGIQVDKNGEIKAMGEKVTKVLVDGEEFFGDDPGMAVKNLRADAVKEVQVFDKKSEQAEFTGIDDGQTKKTINLKLKEDKKKGYFGKVEASGGLRNDIDNRYNNNIMFNAFKGKRKFSFYLLQGNTGQDGLNWQDQQKFGGDDDNTTTSVDEDNGFTMMWRNNSSDEDVYIDPRNGFFENLNLGLQYNNKWNDKKTLNYSPKFNRLQYNNRKSIFSQVNVQGLEYNENAVENTTATKQNVKNNLTFEIKLDSFNTLKLVAKVNFYNNESKVFRQSENTSKTGLLNNTSTSSADNTNDKTVLSNAIIYKHKFRKDRRTFSINTDFNLQDSKNESLQYSSIGSYTGGILDSTFDINQKKNNNSNNKKLLAKAAYTEPLNKYYSMEVSYEYSWLKGLNDLTTLSKNLTSGKYDQYVDSLSNNFDQQFNTHKAGIKFSYKKKKIKYSFGSSAGFTNFDLVDITNVKTYKRDFTNLFPVATFNYSYKANHNLIVNYNGQTIQPTISQLQNLQNNNNNLRIYIGNPNLEQSFRHNLSVSHNSYNFLKEMWTYQSVNLSFTRNAITNSVTIEPNGKTITKPINTNDNVNVNSWIGAGTKIKKWNVQVFMSLSFNYSGFNEVINNVVSENKNTNSMVSINLGKSKDKKYELNLSNDFGYNTNTSTATNRSVNYNTNTLGFSGSVYIKKVWKIGSSYEFNYRQKTSDFAEDVSNHLWNARLERTFKKDEFTVFASINDILNQDLGVDRSLYGNTLSEERNDRLKRYFMVGLRWDFRNKTAVKK